MTIWKDSLLKFTIKERPKIHHRFRMEKMMFWKLKKREEDSASWRNTCHHFYHKSLEEEKLWNFLNQNSKLPSCWQRMMEIRYEKSTISLNTNCFQILQHSWKLKVRESKYFGKGRKAAGVFKAWNIYYIIVLAMCTAGKEFPNHIPLNPKDTSPNPNASLLHAHTTGSLQKLTHK